MLGFILTRHVSSAITNLYWLECVQMIRRFYPENLIVVVDDNSDYRFVSKVTFPRLIVIKSEYAKRGELLPYYYLHRYKFFDRAVILHDSVFVQQKVDFEKFDNVALWHFKDCLYHNKGLEERMLRCLTNNDDALEAHRTGNFKGMFGVMSVVTLEFVTMLEAKYNLLKLLHHVKSRSDRQCLERVFGVLFSVENPTAESVFGDIFQFCRWGGTFLEYKKKRQTKAVVKVWTGR
jgi:hypothetical protein